MPTKAARGMLYLKLGAIKTPSPKRIKALFLHPLERFVSQNKLGSVEVMDDDLLDPGNSVEFCVYSPTDDRLAAAFSGRVALRVDGTAIITDPKEKVLLEGTWLEAARWVFDLFVRINCEHASASAQLSRLKEAAQLLS